jgi:hypothetical protein
MADATEQAIVANETYSVRQFSPSAWGGMIGAGDSFGFLYPARRDLLPAWGTYECDLALRTMHYTQHNSLWGGAVQNFIEKFLSIPYEISGGRNLTFQWQDLFFEAEFGEGYDELVSRGLVDYLTLNRGWFMEKVSYGAPDTPIKEGAKILGINHLDAMRIMFTGNREWPYLYQSEWGGTIHKMHYTRVIHIARQPSPDTMAWGMGKSALFDSITVANAEVLLGRHENELLNDMPPPGIVIFNNVKSEEVQTAMQQFQYERIRDGQNVYKAPLSLSSKDPSQPATVTFVPMATAPEGFDKAKYTQVHVNMLALNLGLDPQDIWPLSGGALGSGEQSKVLAAKTDVKGPGYLATRLTRKWNVVMPRSIEWQYKAQNAQQDKETANLAKLWVDTAQLAKGVMTNDEIRSLIANQVPAFADVLTDESGEVRLFDADPKTPMQITATDNAELDTVSEGDEVTTNSDNESVMVDNPSALGAGSALSTVPPKQPVAPTNKPAIPVVNVPTPKPQVPVANAVESAFKAVSDELKTGLITVADAQRKLGLTPDPVYEGMYMIEGYPVPRDMVGKLWQAHFGRGVASFDAVVSGETMPTGTPPSDATNTQQAQAVETKEIDATTDEFIQEMTAIIQDGVDGTITKAGCAARIRGAIQRYGKSAYLDGMEHGGVDASEADEDDLRTIGDIAVHDTQYVTNLVNEIYSDKGLAMSPESRAQMWMSTTDEFYYAGIASADKNGMYSFEGDDGNESCATCQRLKGQKHRMKWWIEKELRPVVDHDSFECGGWRCQHYLERVT